MNLKPQYKQRFVQALMALFIVVLSITGSVVTDYLTDIGDFEPPPTPEAAAPEAVVQRLNAFDAQLTALQTTAQRLSALERQLADMPIPTDLGPVDYGTTHYTAVEAEDLTATDDLAVGDNAAITGLLTVGETLGVTGNATFAGSATLDTTITERTTLTATTTTITPTHTFYALDSAAAVTITLAASGTDGQMLVLIGDDANTITIADTNIRTSDGNALTLGQYDIVVMQYLDSEWHEWLKLANQ